MTMQPYWWLGALLSGLTLLSVLWFNIGSPLLREYRLRRPVDAFLTLYPEGGHDSWTTELHVQPNSEVVVHLRFRPRLHFKSMDLIFGFVGESPIRPTLIKTRNVFVARGKQREASPDDDDRHYIDYKGNYHIKDVQERVRGTVYAQGYVIQTSKPGRFRVKLGITTDGGDGEPTEPLFIIVEGR